MELPLCSLSETPSLKDRAYEILRAQIVRGVLPPGLHLPEIELSNSMNISRAPVREALNMLARDGFVTIVPRKGASVSVITQEDVRDNWEVRLLIEPYAAKVATPLIPVEEIDKVSALLRRVMHSGDFELYMESDMLLHELLTKYAPNRYLRDLLLTTKAHSMRIRYHAEQSHQTRVSIIDTVTEEHIAVIDGMKMRDCDAVFYAFRAHIERGRARSMEMFRVINPS